MSEMIHLHSTHTIFHNRRGHLWTQKASKLLAAGASIQTPLGELTALPRPHDGGRGQLLPPLQNLTPALSPSGFELRPFGPRNWGPLTYCWTRVPQSLATPLEVGPQLSWQFVKLDKLSTKATNINSVATVKQPYKQMRPGLHFSYS